MLTASLAIQLGYVADKEILACPGVAQRTGGCRCAARRDRYDVDLVSTTFDGDHYEAMRAMQTTDLLLGMHGAGMAHAMFLPPVRCFVACDNPSFGTVRLWLGPALLATVSCVIART